MVRLTLSTLFLGNGMERHKYLLEGPRKLRVNQQELFFWERDFCHHEFESGGPLAPSALSLGNSLVHKLKIKFVVHKAHSILLTLRDLV